MSKISNKRDNVPKPSIVTKSVIATKSAFGTRSNIPIKPDNKMISGVVKKSIIAAKPEIATNRCIGTKTGIATKSIIAAKPGIATNRSIGTKSGIPTKSLPVKKPERNTFPTAVKKTRTSLQPNAGSPSKSSQKKYPSNLVKGSPDVPKSGFVSKSSNLKALKTKPITTSPQSRKSFGVLRPSGCGKTEISSNCEGSASGCSSDVKRRAFGAMVTKSRIPRTGVAKPSTNRKPSSYNESLSSRISNKSVLDQTLGHKLEISTNSSVVEGQQRIKESPKLTNSDLLTRQNRVFKKKLTSTPRNHQTFPRIFPPSSNSVISLTSSFPPPSLRRLPGSDTETVLEGLETRTLIEEAARLSLGVEAMTIMVGAGKTDGEFIKDYKKKEEENGSLEMRKIMDPATGDKIKQLERDIERMQRKQEEAVRAQEEVHRCREESLRLELERKEQEREEKYKVMMAQEKEEHRKKEDWYLSEVKRLTQQIEADSEALKIALEKKEILETIVNELEVKVTCLETVLREFSKMTNIDQEVVNANVRTKLMALMAKRGKCDFEGDIETKGL